MKGLMFVFLFSILVCSVNAQEMIQVKSGIKRTVTTIKNNSKKHSTIKRVGASISVSSNSTKPKSGIIRTIHSVPNIDTEKYKYQKDVKRVAGVNN